MTVIQALLITLSTWFCAWAEAFFAFPMLCTPLVLAPITGLILGDLATGIICGAMLQLVFLGIMGIGGTVPPDADLGTVIGTAFAIILAEDVEVALAIAVPVAALGSFLGLLNMVIKGLFNPLVDHLCDTGNYKGIELTHCLLSFLPSLPKNAILFVSLLYGSGAAEWLLDYIPSYVIDGVGVASGLLPALGIGLLLKQMWSARMAVYYFIGFLLVSYFNIPIIAVACFGVILVVVQVLEKGYGKKNKAVAAVSSAESAEEELFND